MKLTIPIKITDNRRHIISRFKRRLIDSPEYKAWKEQAIWYIKNQLSPSFKKYDPSFEKQLVYCMKVYLKDKRSDAANYDKGVRDVLTQAGVWSDDKWCLPAFLPVEIDKNRPRVEITID